MLNLQKSNELLNQYFEGEIFCGTIGITNFMQPLVPAPIVKPTVNGYHVFSSAPLQAHGTDKIEIPDYLLLTIELSARLWKRYNGPITFITDTPGLHYFQERGLLEIYDEVLPVLDTALYGIDDYRFWAAGKILTLKMLNLPCAIVDLDLLVWQSLPLDDCDLAAAHIEHINERFYPPFSHFMMSPRYRFPKEWSDTVEPLNTSFLYLKNRDLRNYYTQESTRFMQYERGTPDDGSVCMVFAEQRILAMCAAAMNIHPRTFLDYDHLEEAQPYFTHIWSGKHFMRQVPEIAERYCQLCKAKLAELSEL